MILSIPQRTMQAVERGRGEMQAVERGRGEMRDSSASGSGGSQLIVRTAGRQSADCPYGRAAVS